MGSETQHTIVFVGGLHRSGTTLLADMLGRHPSISSLGAEADEGQHLQSVYPPAYAYGGPGTFGYRPEMHVTERSDLVSPESRKQLWEDWSGHWDLTKPVLVEKSPPNITKSRFLQALFPDARFVFITRHPLPASIATIKWSDRPLFRLVDHWIRCHQILLADVPHLSNHFFVRYEDLIADPRKALEPMLRHIGVDPEPLADIPSVSGEHNERYFARWRAGQWKPGRRARIEAPVEQLAIPVVLEQRVRALGFGYSLRAPFVTDPA